MLIRSASRGSGSGHHHSTYYRIALYAVTIVMLAIGGILAVSPLPLPSTDNDSDNSSTRSTNHTEEVSPRIALLTHMPIRFASRFGIRGSKAKDQHEENTLEISHGFVPFRHSMSGYLKYYRCGPLPTKGNHKLRELVLLHGANHNKEDWLKSGILDMLCKVNSQEKEGKLSVTALDMPVSVDGLGLRHGFDALVQDQVLSGRPVIFVSPSASAKSVLHRASMAASSEDEDNQEELSRIIKAWIPITPRSVLAAGDKTLQHFREARIPILSIHGREDDNANDVTDRLKELSDARGVEMEGGHTFYLDSPQEFVQEVMKFVNQISLRELSVQVKRRMI